MALSDPRSIFGVHSVSAYDRTTREFKGILKVLGSSSLTINSEMSPLTGGSSKFPWHIEDGAMTAELALTFRQYDSWIYELFLGKAATDISAEASGNVSTLENTVGTSVFDATTGIASIAAESGQESELKFAHYVVKAVSATTIDIYASSDADFGRGTLEDFENDLLKITPSPLTVSGTGGVTSVANFGLEITGGSGAVALVTDDVAIFRVRPVHTGGAMEVVIGGQSDSLPEFGAVVMAKKRGNGELFEAELYRVKAAGLPINFNENEWSEASVTAQAFNDSARGGIGRFRFVKP